ncbi:hypothetical protein KVR01_000100 [Diaporthe batatas]|uniref:uncharacterized protein n=1 Tax=Diaporthe batatas TaxID=748121 RepID=UPI001D056438|nr:uncharacterized protein KVR01_000100 [Diaporthe batatas]KAG8169355.1 hypothetical protein KVR01_000100 [Diaporthe batatas]
MVLPDVDLDQLKQLLTEPVQFLVGGDGVAFHICRGLLSRLSGPFHTLVHGGIPSTKGCVDWMVVEEAVFWRFAQFVHTGSYTDFAPVGEDGPYHNNNANDSVAGGAEEQADTSSSGERLLPAYSGAHPKASSESHEIERSDVFRLPYSLVSYESAANMWLINRFYTAPHSTSCKDQGGPVRLPSKRKFEEISCNCGPSEKKRDCIAAFIAQCGSLPPSIENEEGIKLRGDVSTRRTRSAEQLLIHAKVWFLAERYAVASLMELACSYLVDELAQWTISASDFVPKFSALVR